MREEKRGGEDSFFQPHLRVLTPHPQPHTPPSTPPHSILAFETKISAGNGEVFLTRDFNRLCRRMDLFRLMHFYHSGLGYFTTARLLMLTIYVQVGLLGGLWSRARGI